MKYYLLFMLLGGQVQAYNISKIEGESGEKLSIAKIRLSKDAPWQKLKPKKTAYNSFVQIELPQATVLRPGVFYDLVGPYFKKAVAYQDQDLAIVRVFTSFDSEKHADLINLDLFKERAVLSIDHRAISGRLKPSAVPEPTTPAKAVVSKPLASPVNELSPLPVLDEKLEIAAWFSLGLLLFSLAVLTLKRLLRNRSLKAEGNYRKLHSIASLALSAKQKLNLVQVGESQLLIAVGPEGIQILKQWPPVIAPNQSQKIPVSSSFQQQLKAQRKKKPGIAQREGAAVYETAAANKPKRKRAVQPEPEEEKVEDKNAAQEAINDVTQLIREKLRALPNL